MTNTKVQMQSGVITKADSSCPSEELCFPTAAIAVYDGVKGKKLGIIKQVKSFELSVELSKKLVKPFNDGLNWQGELGYDSNAIGFLKAKEGFVLVALLVTDSGKKEFWLEAKALESAGYKAFSWPEFLPKYTGMVSVAEPLNLRKLPKATGARLASVGFNDEIEFTGNFKGLWAEIKVKKYNQHMCYGEVKLLAEFTGWVKYFDAKTNQTNLELGGSC